MIGPLRASTTGTQHTRVSMSAPLLVRMRRLLVVACPSLAVCNTVHQPSTSVVGLRNNDMLLPRVCAGLKPKAEVNASLTNLFRCGHSADITVWAQRLPVTASLSSIASDVSNVIMHMLFDSVLSEG